MAYTSWPCPDLGGITLYSSDYISNPDWNNFYGGYMCPIDRPIGYNIVDHFAAEINNARDTQTAWDSGIIVVGRAGYDDTGLRSQWMLIRLTADPVNDTFTVMFGTGNTKTAFYSAKVYQMTFLGLNWLPEYLKCFYVFRFLGRNMSYSQLPGYTGNNHFVLFFGIFHSYKGVWESPTGSYPYGRMRYSLLDVVDPVACLLSTPCAGDNQQSRMEQSSAVMLQVLQGGGPVQEIDADYMADDAGNHDSDPPEPDPNEGDSGGPSKPGGGDGDHRMPYDPVPVPGLPDIGPNSAGFVYMVTLTVAEMQTFAADLLRPTMWTAIKNFFADPMDFICGIMIVPYTPTSSARVYPKFGENVFQYSYSWVTHQYKEIDCGSLDITKYFGSCFDNNPFTELLVWLPYVGYRKLDPDECMGKRVHIKYHCDCMTGDCVCFISTEAGNPPYSRVIAQYDGNCGVRVPFGSNSFDAAIQASVQLLGGAVGAMAGGIVAGPTGVAAGGMAAAQIANSVSGSTVTAVNASKARTERSGVAGASAGYLSVQKPYLLRTVPQQSLPTNYKDLEGYPSNIAGPLTGFNGYAAVETINLNGLTATKEEISEIQSLLTGGVYI